MRSLITVSVLFVLVAGCGQQVAGTALPVADDVAVTGVARPSAPKSKPSSGRSTSTTKASEGRVPLSQIEGKWDGSYTCTQGETGLTLAITNAEDGTADATFEFFPVPGNPNVKTGSFAMKVTITAGGQLKFTQDKWINEPPGYGMVDLLVTSAPGTEKMTGQVVGAGSCTTFSVTHK